MSICSCFPAIRIKYLTLGILLAATLLLAMDYQGGCN